MVGIIVASHGSFAQGLFETGKMIVGEQENVAVCSLMPNEGPDDLRNKIETAISSFSDKDEVLILADLWSGTPFNQANSLLETMPKMAIVTGMNLPMLIEAYDAREEYSTAHEVASAIISQSREGIKVKPESLYKEKKIEKISKDTVIGNGKISYVLARIDTRLLHGQVATSWTKATNPNRIITVSDNVSKDELRKSMIVEAAPPGVKSNVIPISKLVEIDKDTRFGNTKALLLFETPQDALRAIEKGVDIKELNLGSMAHSVGKVAVTTSVAMDMEDVKVFEKLMELGVKIDVRKVPADTPESIEQILSKVKAKFQN